MSRKTKKEMKKLLRLYFIMGSVNCAKAPVEVLQEAIQGGITLFQYREKGQGALTGEAKVRLAKQLQEVCKNHHIPFIVNDDVDLALALDADGVHVGQDDESASIVRDKIGDKILGISAHNLEEANKAIADGADYLGLGPIFETKTKEDAKEVQGVNLIRSFRENGIQQPLVGIGGISTRNAASVIQSGADGISVISAISQAESIVERTKELQRLVIKK